MTDEIIEVLAQTLILLGCVQTSFVYYIGLKPRFHGRISAWFKCSLSIYLCNFILKTELAVSLPVYMIIMLFVNITIVIVIYKNSFWEYIRWWFTVYIIVSLPAEVLAVFLSMLVQKAAYTDLFLSNEIAVIAKLLANIIMMICIAFFLIVRNLFFHSNSGWRVYLLFLSIPFYQIVLFIAYFIICDHLSVSIIIVGYMIAIFSIIIDFAVIIVIDNLNNKIIKEEELSILEGQRRQELKYFEQNIRKLEILRSVRHDLGNQLQTLAAMMEMKENRDTVKKLIRKMKDRLEEVM